MHTEHMFMQSNEDWSRTLPDLTSRLQIKSQANAYQVELNTWATKEGPMPLQQTKGEFNNIPPYNQDFIQTLNN